MKHLLKVEPVAIGTAITATLAILAALGVNQALCGTIGAAAVAWLVVARGLVAPLPHVVGAVQSAATQAANMTASDLTEQTAGSFGEVTETAEAVTEDAAKKASKIVLRTLGVRTSDH